MITVPANFIADLKVILSLAEQGENHKKLTYLLECVIAMLIPYEED